jgi:hypothetical protein
LEACGEQLQQQQQQQQQGEDVAAWLSAAPKLLWQLGTSKPRISQMLLQLLFEASRLTPPGSLIQQQLTQLQPQLAAVLATLLPPPAAPQPPTAALQVMLGPLAGLPAACQVLAVDTITHQQQLTPPLLKAVVLACRVSAYQDAAVQRLLDGVLGAGAGGSSLPPADYASLAATLLSPAPAGGYVERGGRQRIAAGFARHQLLVRSVCRWLQAYGPLPELLQLLAPPLLRQWQALADAMPNAAAGSRTCGSGPVCCLSYSLSCLAALAADAGVPLPPELAALLPQVLAAHLLSASDAAVDSALQQLVLPLASALPDVVALPLLQQLAAAAASLHGHLRLAVAVTGRLLRHSTLKLLWLREHARMALVLAQLSGAAAGGGGGREAHADLAVEVARLEACLAALCMEH